MTAIVPILPKEIKRLDRQGVRITWSDGLVSDLPSALLRRNCPCAQCREKRGDGSHASPLTPRKPSLLRVVEATADEALALESVSGVGNYAINLLWGDGHGTGIYSFQYLRELASTLNARKDQALS